MKNRPPAMSRNKEKIRVPPISPNGRSLQRYAKPKRKLRELRLSINGRRFKEPKPKINVAHNGGSYTQVRTASASRRMSSRKAARAESKISEAKDAHRKPLLPRLTGS